MCHRKDDTKPFNNWVVVQLSMYPKYVIFNRVHSRPLHVTNLIILIVKQYIHRCKCMSTIPNIEEAWNEVKLQYKIEIENSGMNWNIKNNLMRVKRKWSPVQNLLV